MLVNLLENIRAVIFDVGNTLTTPDWERVHSVSRRISDSEFQEIELQNRISKILLAADSDPDFLKNLADKSVRTGWHFRQVYKDLGFDESQLEELLGELDKLHFERHLWTRLNEEVFEVFEQLKDRGFLLGVISNSEDGRVEDLLRSVELLPFLDVYLDSFTVGYTKPDARIFLKAVEELGVAPREAVFIGDTYTQDILGARNAGLKPILFDPLDLHQQEDVIRIRSLKELINGK